MADTISSDGVSTAPGGGAARVVATAGVDPTSLGRATADASTVDAAAPPTSAGRAPRERWNVTPERVLLGEQLLKSTSPTLTAYYWEAIRALREGDDLIRFS